MGPIFFPKLQKVPLSPPPSRGGKWPEYTPLTYSQTRFKQTCFVPAIFFIIHLISYNHLYAVNLRYPEFAFTLVVIDEFLSMLFVMNENYV